MGKLINLFDQKDNRINDIRQSLNKIADLQKDLNQTKLEKFKASLGEKENRRRNNIRLMNKMGLGSKSVEEKISDYTESNRYRPNSSTASKRPAKAKSVAEKSSGLKYMVRADEYKSSNVYYSVPGEFAVSYGWWRFVSRINGVLIFNTLRYSPSTGKHQSKVMSLLDSLGLEYYRVETRLSLSEGTVALESCIKNLEDDNTEMQKAIDKKGNRKTTNIRRAKKIELNKTEIKTLKKIINYKSKKPKIVSNVERFWV